MIRRGTGGPIPSSWWLTYHQGDVASIGVVRDGGGDDDRGDPAQHTRHAVEVVDAAGVLDVEGRRQVGLDAGEAEGRDRAGHQTDEESAAVGGGEKERVQQGAWLERRLHRFRADGGRLEGPGLGEPRMRWLRVRWPSQSKHEEGARALMQRNPAPNPVTNLTLAGTLTPLPGLTQGGSPISHQSICNPDPEPSHESSMRVQGDDSLSVAGASLYLPRGDGHSTDRAHGDAAGQGGVLDINDTKPPTQEHREGEGGDAAPWAVRTGTLVRLRGESVGHT